MNKTLFAVLFIGMIYSAVAGDVFTDVKTYLKNDQCVVSSMESVRPELEQKIAAYTEKRNVQTQTELIAIIQKVKKIAEACEVNNKVQPMLGDAIEAAGISFLLASNCFKDVGAVLLIADEAVQDPTNVENDIIILIFTALLGRQGLADCKQFVNFIIG